MSDPCYDCEISTAKECFRNRGRCKCGKDIVMCEHCGYRYIWDKLPYENIKMVGNGRLEHFGTPCEEMVVDGWVCPDCGHRNDC